MTKPQNEEQSNIDTSPVSQPAPTPSQPPEPLNPPSPNKVEALPRDHNNGGNFSEGPNPNIVEL